MATSKADLDPLAVTLLVTRVLDDLDIPYFIAGSMASTLYGVIRTTQDSDIVVDMEVQHVEPFIQALNSTFFIDDKMVEEAVRQRSSFNILHRESMFKVDLFIPPPRAFTQNQFNRARSEALSENSAQQVRVASAEDTILAKLEWFRQGGEVSERQWRDVLGLINVQRGALDLDYMRRTAMELQVGDLLDRALRDAEQA